MARAMGMSVGWVRSLGGIRMAKHEKAMITAAHIQ